MECPFSLVDEEAVKESRGRNLVIATREDVTMLREVIQVLGGADNAPKTERKT